MAVMTAVLSGNIADLGLGIESTYLRRVVLVIESNTTGSLLLDTSGNTLLAGAKRVTIDTTTGAYTQTLVKTNSADIEPASGRLYKATLIYPSGTPGAGNVTQTSGWFELTADTSLADVWQGLEVTEVSDALLASLSDLAAEVAADATATAADRAAVEAIGTTTDTLIASRVNDYTSATRTALRGRDKIYNILDYGASTASTDNSAAIQAAIDACIGGNPAGGASTGRIAAGAVYVPPGNFKVQSELKIYSVLGFKLFGAGESSIISANAAAMTKVLDINGSFMGVFEDFSIRGNGGVTTVDTAISVEWASAVATRSTTGNKFSRINIRDLKFKIGYGTALFNGSAQNDNSTFLHCSIIGAWSSGETTWYQSGFKFGNGTHGNALNHQLFGCTSSASRYNVHVYAVGNVNTFGGSFGNAEVDFYFQSVSGLATVSGVRSEASQRFLLTGAAAGHAHVTLKDVIFSCVDAVVAADKRIIQFGLGGALIVDNFMCYQTLTNPVIYMNGNATKMASVLVRGGAYRQTLTSLVTSPSDTAPFVATLIGVSTIDSSGSVSATAAFLQYGRGPTGTLTAGGTKQLHMLSPYGGFLPHPVTTANRPVLGATGAAITTTDEGLTVYDTTLDKLITWDGAAWRVSATMLTATATLDFPSIAAATSQELTVTVTGAVAGDTVALGAPTTIEAGLVWNGYVSAADTVKVRVTNITAAAIDPASASWKVTVTR